jgi:membrane protease YdiL (CAAX protease family)
MDSSLNDHWVKASSRAQLNWTEQLVEISVFLFLIVPSLALSFFAIKQGDLGFTLTAVATILRDLSLLSLVLFFLWRNGEPVKLIGWNFKKAWKEILLGVGLFIPTFLGVTWLDRFLQTVGFSAPATPQPSLIPALGMTEFALAFVLVVVVALTEETIFRGYLLLRFRNIIANSTIAVVLSAVIFSLGHGYEGTAGVISVGVMGFIFAVVYIWRGSLVAPMVMHFLQDFLGIVLLPLLLGLR